MTFLRIEDQIYNLNTVAYIDFVSEIEITLYFGKDNEATLDEDRTKKFVRMIFLPVSAIRVGRFAINLNRLMSADLSNYDKHRTDRRISIRFSDDTEVKGFPMPDLVGVDADEFNNFIRNYYPGPP
jgi:hypothetical protein